MEEEEGRRTVLVSSIVVCEVDISVVVDVVSSAAAVAVVTAALALASAAAAVITGVESETRGVAG